MVAHIPLKDMYTLGYPHVETITFGASTQVRYACITRLAHAMLLAYGHITTTPSGSTSSIHSASGMVSV